MKPSVESDAALRAALLDKPASDFKRINPLLAMAAQACELPLTTTFYQAIYLVAHARAKTSAQSNKTADRHNDAFRVRVSSQLSASCPLLVLAANLSA